jgi:hypothetical protein
MEWVGTENAYLTAWFSTSIARKEEPQSEAFPRELKIHGVGVVD